MRQYVLGLVTGLVLAAGGVYAFDGGFMTPLQRDNALQQLQLQQMEQQQRQMDRQSGAYMPRPC